MSGLIGYIIQIISYLSILLALASSQCTYTVAPGTHCTVMCVPFHKGFANVKPPLEGCFEIKTDGSPDPAILIVSLVPFIQSTGARRRDCEKIKVKEVNVGAFDKTGFPVGQFQLELGGGGGIGDPGATGLFSPHCNLVGKKREYVWLPENEMDPVKTGAQLPAYLNQACQKTESYIKKLKERTDAIPSSPIPGIAQFVATGLSASSIDDFEGLGMLFKYQDKVSENILFIAEVLFTDSAGRTFVDTTSSNAASYYEYIPLDGADAIQDCFIGQDRARHFNAKFFPRGKSPITPNSTYLKELNGEGPPETTTTTPTTMAPDMMTSSSSTSTTITTTSPLPTTPAPEPERIGDIYKNCDVTKKCLASDDPGGKGPEFVPTRLHENDTCAAKNDCRVMVSFGDVGDQNLNLTFQSSRNYVYMEIVGKTDSWVAVALSRDDKIGDDFVIECARGKDSKVRMYTSRSWIARSRKIPSYERMLANSDRHKLIISRSIGYESGTGTLFCKFLVRRELFYYDSLQSDGNKWHSFKLVTTLHHLFMFFGEGGGDDSGGNLTSHSPNEVWSSGFMVGIGSRFSPTPSQQNLIHVHGQIMYFVFVFIFPNAVFLSRYCKETFVKRKFFRLKNWKLAHIITQCLGLLLIFIGHFCLTLGNEDWSNPLGPDKTNLHFWTSLIAAALYFSNVLIGILNCRKRKFGAPKCDRGHLFHGILGHFTYLIAMVTLIDAEAVQFSDLPCSTSGIIGAWIFVYFGFHIVMSLYYCWAEWIESVGGVGYSHAFGLPELLVQPEASNFVAPGKKIRLVIMGLFMASSFLFTLALMIIGGTAKKENACHKFDHVIEFYKKQ